MLYGKLVLLFTAFSSFVGAVLAVLFSSFSSNSLDSPVTITSCPLFETNNSFA